LSSFCLAEITDESPPAEAETDGDHQQSRAGQTSDEEGQRVTRKEQNNDDGKEAQSGNAPEADKVMMHCLNHGLVDRIRTHAHRDTSAYHPAIKSQWRRMAYLETA
jgi:hypothetical protein